MKGERYLIICSQNVGRSQMGEGYLRSLFADSSGVVIMSAGINTKGMRKKYHNRPHPQVVHSMQEEGIDISHGHITQLRKRHMRKATKIISLCDVSELPQYANKFAEKMLIAPITDPASITRDIPVVEADRLRAVRDEIKQVMITLHEGGEKHV